MPLIMVNVQLVFSLIFKKRLTPLIMISYQIVFIIMASGGLPWNASKVRCQIDIKLLNIMIMNQRLEKHCVEFHKGLY